MNILITGATGFIGKNLTQSLLKSGFNVHIYARRSSIIPKKIRLNKVLFSDELIEVKIKFLKTNKIEGIVHLAALYINEHKASNIKDLINSNIILGTQLLEAAVNSQVNWFLNTGTLFQHYNDDTYNPVNLYAATKQAFEDIAKFYYETTILNFVTIKLNDTYGPGDTRRKIFNLWVEIAENGEILEMSPGKQIIEILHIDDVVDGFLKLIDLLHSDTKAKYAGKVFTLNSKERISLKKLSKLFEKATGKKLNIKWGARDYRPREVMSPAYIHQVVPGWEQRITLLQGISGLNLDKN